MHPFRQYATVATGDRPLHLEQGGLLNNVVIAFETYGTLSPGRDNAILVTHALTGDSHVAAHNCQDEAGWWDDLVGPGQPIDTNRFFVICSNVLGGCQGSTGPASPDPVNGQPYGMRFPTVTIRDMVRAQRRLLEQLDIKQLALVVGGSMGGMQALEWAVSYPDYMDGVVIIAAPGYTTAQAIAYNKVARDVIMHDPDWRGGDYYGEDGPRSGLAIARALGMITYQSEPYMANKFGCIMQEGRFAVESYLDYQGEKLVNRFDANSYLYLLRALDLYNVGAGYPSYDAALERVKARMLVVGVSSDILYPAYQQLQLVSNMQRLGAQVEYAEIASPHGHDGFLIDFPLLRPILTNFIRTTSPVRNPWLQSLFRASCSAYFGARLISDID